MKNPTIHLHGKEYFRTASEMRRNGGSMDGEILYMVRDSMDSDEFFLVSDQREGEWSQVLIPRSMKDSDFVLK